MAISSTGYDHRWMRDGLSLTGQRNPPSQTPGRYGQAADYVLGNLRTTA
jgi:hypothetical protein